MASQPATSREEERMQLEEQCGQQEAAAAGEGESERSSNRRRPEESPPREGTAVKLQRHAAGDAGQAQAEGWGRTAGRAVTLFRIPKP